MNTTIVTPSKPKIIKEEGNKGSYEIGGLYPGYGHTLGNSLRRIILSSLSGVAITSIKIAGIPHEFSTIKGITEDVISMILNLKKVRFSLLTGDEIVLILNKKGIGEVKASDIDTAGQVEILTPDQHIANITEADAVLQMEITLTRGIGYVSKEVLQKDRVAIETIAIDASFSPIVNVSYDVEQMRVGDRTDFNRLVINIETDGSLTPKEALEKSIEIMIYQLKGIIDFQEPEAITPDTMNDKIEDEREVENKVDKDILDDVLKTRIESLDISQRTINALIEVNIRTIGGLIRKKEKDLLAVDGIGKKGLEELKEVLSKFDLSIKE